MAVDDRKNIYETYKSSLRYAQKRNGFSLCSALFQSGWVDLYLQAYHPGDDPQKSTANTVVVDSEPIKLSELFKDNWKIRFIFS